jgi:oligosaccharide repeat unit polymerase
VIGTLYVDFGVLGICIGMFLLSMCIHALYENWRSRGSVSALLIYALTLAYSLTSIHTGGYFEPVYVLSCLFIALLPRVASLMNELLDRSAG